VTQTPSIKSQLEALERLQELDLRILNLENKRKALPSGMKEVEKQWSALNRQLSAKVAEREEVERSLRQTQAARELNQDRVNRAKEKLDQVGNQVEFQAAGRELDQLKKSNEDLEKKSADMQGQIDEMNKGMEDLQTRVDELKAKLDEQGQVVESEVGELNGAIGELMEKRGTMTGGVTPPILSRYDRVRKARAGLGVVPAVGGRCKGCNMVLPHQLFNQIGKAEEIISCPSCQRILIDPAISGVATENEAGSDQV